MTESENFHFTSYNISDDVLDADDDSNNVIQIAARSKTSRSFDSTMAASRATASFSFVSHQFLVVVLGAAVAVLVSNSNLSMVSLRHRLRVSA